MDTVTKNKILGLYPDYVQVYGPYTRKDGRKIIVLYDGTRRTTKQYARVIKEMDLGRVLSESETVDHIDNDISNDSISNLQVLSRSDNAKKQALDIYGAPQELTCAHCGASITRSASSLTNKTGMYFCSKHCRSQKIASNQWGIYIK